MIEAVRLCLELPLSTSLRVPNLPSVCKSPSHHMTFPVQEQARLVHRLIPKLHFETLCRLLVVPMMENAGGVCLEQLMLMLMLTGPT